MAPRSFLSCMHTHHYIIVKLRARSAATVAAVHACVIAAAAVTNHLGSAQGTFLRRGSKKKKKQFDAQGRNNITEAAKHNFSDAEGLKQSWHLFMRS